MLQQIINGVGQVDLGDIGSGPGQLWGWPVRCEMGTVLPYLQLWDWLIHTCTNRVDLLSSLERCRSCSIAAVGGQG